MCRQLYNWLKTVETFFYLFPISKKEQKRCIILQFFLILFNLFYYWKIIGLYYVDFLCIMNFQKMKNSYKKTKPLSKLKTLIPIITKSYRTPFNIFCNFSVYFMLKTYKQIYNRINYSLFIISKFNIKRCINIILFYNIYSFII